MSLMSKLDRLDRRYIFILMIAAVVYPYLAPIGLPITVSEGAQKFYEVIEALPAGTKVLYAFDTSAGTFPELIPQGVATMSHLLSKDLKMYVIAFENGEGVMGFETIARPQLKTAPNYGENYVNLGFYAGVETSMAAFTADPRELVKTDYHGTPIDQIPMWKEITSVKDFGILIYHGSLMPDYLRQFHAPGHITKIIAGVQGLRYTEQLVYIGGGQVITMLNGLIGAAEYELVSGNLGKGVAASDAISLTHLVVIGAIFLGNIGYLFRRGQQKT